MAWQTPKVNWISADGVADVDFNRIEGNIQVLVGTDNKSTVERKVLDIPTDIRKIEVTRASGQITLLTVKDPSDNSTVSTTTVNRTSEQISSIVVTVGGKTLTYTVNRVSGQISSVTKAVS